MYKNTGPASDLYDDAFYSSIKTVVTNGTQNNLVFGTQGGVTALTLKYDQSACFANQICAPSFTGGAYSGTCGVYSDYISVASGTGGSSTFWGNVCISNNKCTYFSGNINVAGIACFGNSAQSTDFRYTNTGYLTYDTTNTGTECLVIRKNGTSVLTFNSNSSATFANTVCTNAGLVTNTLSLSCNTGDDRSIYMSLNCSANYNSGAANTIARSVNSLKFLWFNNCWEIGATRGDDTAIQALVVAKNGNTYLAMNCNGISCFACPTSISRAYNASYGSLQVGGIVDSFSDNSVFRAWNAAAGFAGGSGTDAWAFSGNNTDYAVYGANDLYLYSGGIRRLQFTGGGVACFKCTVCAPQFISGAGTVTNPYGSWTTLFTIPTGQMAVYIAHAVLAGQGGYYTSTVMLGVNSAAISINHISNAGGACIRVDGYNVQVSNGSGFQQQIDYKYFRMG